MTLESCTKYDSELQKITHYQKYPAMMPWVGKGYGSPKHKRLLVIAESHYLEGGIDFHRCPQAWYEGGEEWMKTELGEKNAYVMGWINTRNTFSEHKNVRNMGPRICEALRDASANKCAKNENLISQIAFYNFFQRPANQEGRAIKPCSLDIEKAREVFLKVVSVLRPDLIVFVSASSHDASWSVHPSLPIQKDFILRSVHPTTRGGKWWKSTWRSGRRGGLSGQAWTTKFLKEHQWENLLVDGKEEEDIYIRMLAHAPRGIGKYEVVEWLSEQCKLAGKKTLTVHQLSRILNELGLKTDYGAPYQGTRGTYRLVKTAYKRLESQGKQDVADQIARTFVRPDGTYAYK